MGIKNGLYRSGQFMLGKMQVLVPWHMPEVIKGAGSLMKVPDLLKEHKNRHILVVTTAGFIKRGTLEDFFSKVKDAHIKVTVFDRVKPDPDIATIEAGVQAYLAAGCDSIVAIGGGSVLDCAKVIGARIVRPDKKVLDMTGMLKIHKKLPPFYAVPTTAGTGSEVTVAAVITDEHTHRKHPVGDPCLLPAYAILDAELTKSLPADITAATGMDALTHAVEAYINLFTRAECDESAIEAVKLIFANLEKAYVQSSNGDSNDLKAREDLLWASYLAGTAFTRSYVGYVHAIAHGIGGLYGVPHGFANAVILPVVLESYKEAVWPDLAKLAVAAGLKGQTDADLAVAFIQAIKDMNQKMGIPEKLTMIEEKDIPELVKRADAEANPAYPVPVIWDKAELEAVIRRLR